MSQISPPVRILLAGALVFMMAWFVFLRPGDESSTSTPAPAPGSGLGTAVQGAKGTAAAANAAAAVAAAQGESPASAAASPATASKPSTTASSGKAAGAEAKKKAADLGLPKSVASAMAADKTLVMLFWNRNAIDDRAVRRELRGIDRHKGKVKVHVASIRDVARYAPITRGVNLEQSPTVVVVKGKTADALVGYVDRGTIDQTVSDVMRAR